MSRAGLRGLWLVAPIAALLAVGAGGPERSLLVLGPLITYTLPVLVMVAFGWEDGPGTRLGPDWAGWADTVLIAAGGVLLTAAGQALAGGLDLRGIFDPFPGPGHLPTFPATLPLAGAAFTVLLQITLVGEGWPLRRLPARLGGPLALGASWLIALAICRTFGKPGADFAAAVVCIGGWQVLCFVVWRGWPTSRIAARAARLACAHALVLGGGLLSYALLRRALDAPAVTAAAGCLIAAGLTVGMLFELRADPPLAAAATLLVALALLAALSALAGAFSFTRAEARDWVAHASLNAITVSIILHVGVGRRWPFASGGQ
jgi:hypothetical protein